MESYRLESVYARDFLCNNNESISLIFTLGIKDNVSDDGENDDYNDTSVENLMNDMVDDPRSSSLNPFDA